MRVAHVGNYKPESANGVNQAIARYTEYLSLEGFEVELWHFTPKVNAIKERKVNGITIFDLPAHRGRLRNLLSLPKKTQHFLQHRSQSVDLIHLHSVFLPENLWVARLGTPYLVSPHGGYSPQVVGGRNRLLKQIWISLWERSYLNRARAVHAVSQSEADELRSFGIKAPVISIPKGVDAELLTRHSPKPHEASAWIYLGRLAVDHKGLDLLVRGYALLYEQRDGELPPLVLAGPDFRGGRRQLEQLAQSCSIAGSVRFEGPVFGEDKLALLVQAKLFVHTSRFDTLPFSVLEALALGRPVLVTPETHFTQYIEKYGAGWVVEGTPEAIARALHTALQTSPQELDAAGDRARSLVRDNFEWASVAERMSEVYREVAK